MVYTLFTKEYLLNDVPSRADGVDFETETRLRKTIARLISTAGLRLKLPQWVIARATIDCHRFYAVKSYKRNHRFLVSAASLLLAAKSEDCPRPLHDILVVCWEVWNKNKPEEKFRIDSDLAFYEALREGVLNAERAMLYARGFDMTTPHPFHELLRILKQEKMVPWLMPDGGKKSRERDLTQACWNLVNDSLATTVFLQYHPTVIAKGVVYLGCRLLKCNFPVAGGQTLQEYLEVDQATLDDIASQIMEQYTTSFEDLKSADSQPSQPAAEPSGPADTSAPNGAEVAAQAAQSTAPPAVVVKVEQASSEEAGVASEEGELVDTSVPSQKHLCSNGNGHVGNGHVYSKAIAAAKDIGVGCKRKSADSSDLPASKVLKACHS